MLNKVQSKSKSEYVVAPDYHKSIKPGLWTFGDPVHEEQCNSLLS